MLKQKSSKELLSKTKHSSIDIPDESVETVTSNSIKTNKNKMPGDIWWNKFINLGDVLKSKNNFNEIPVKKTKTQTQTTLDSFLKSSSKPDSFKSEIRHSGSDKIKRKVGEQPVLQKQLSVGSYPILLNIEEQSVISRNRPATVCGDKPETEHKNTLPLTLERPRKKLSFKDPEISGCSQHLSPSDTLRRKNIKPFITPQLPRSNLHNCTKIQKWSSYEDLDLESQAMRVVRTVGQAFEVCHKLSITNPNDQEQDDKESDHLCQDVQKDAFSSEKSSNLYVKKEPFSENNVSERSSIRLAGEDPNDRLCSESISDTNPSEKPISSLNLDILPSSSNSNFTRRQEVSASETHVSPDIERLSNMSGILPTASSTLSAHHELHLLREQLEQQTQQTQAALAQVQLLRDQLAAEQSARLEAQARTHQLLTHNKELLDHITALLSHLQDNERTTLHGQQQNTVPPPITMVPQLSSAAKVERWFELLGPLSISRPESGFVSCQEAGEDTEVEHAEEDDDERAILEGTRTLLNKLSSRKQRKLLGLRLGKVTTF